MPPATVPQQRRPVRKVQGGRQRRPAAASASLRAQLVGIADKADLLAFHLEAIAKRAEARVAADLARAARDAASDGR